MRQQREALTKLLVNHTVATIQETTPAQVRAVTEFSFEYLDNVMRADAYETVSFPFFGKFVARLKQIKYRQESKAKPKRIRSKQ